MIGISPYLALMGDCIKSVRVCKLAILLVISSTGIQPTTTSSDT